MTAERVFILYQGGEPETGELAEIVRVVEREAGVDLVGVRITTYPAADPTEMLAHALALRLEDEGQVAPDVLRRMTTYTLEAAGGRRVVAVTWLPEVNSWVRRTIPVHLARSSGLALTRRPGWAWLTAEPAVSFVASAFDGAGRRFPDVHVVVSVLPEARPRRVRRLIGGGYLGWVDGVFRGADVRLLEVDVAHWLLCGRNLHLAYLAADRDELVLLPWELLSRAEKRRGSKLA